MGRPLGRLGVTKRQKDIPDSIYTEIGARICLLRMDACISQQTLADQTGLTRSTVTNTERGRQRIGIDTLYDIARVLDVEITDLLPARIPLIPEETS